MLASKLIKKLENKIKEVGDKPILVKWVFWDTEMWTSEYREDTIDSIDNWWKIYEHEVDSIILDIT